MKQPLTPHQYFDIYKDAAGEWRWRFRARNGKIMAASTEGYKRRKGAVHCMVRLSKAFRGEL